MLRAAGVTFGNGTLNKSIWQAYCDLPAAFQIRTLEGA
jgi:hypothetical protein